jgi:hypothetical protein
MLELRLLRVPWEKVIGASKSWFSGGKQFSEKVELTGSHQRLDPISSAEF